MPAWQLSAWRGGGEVPEAAQRLPSAASGEGEAAADDRVERVQLELEVRRDAEVPAGAAEAPEKFGILVRTRADDPAVGCDEFCPGNSVAGQAVLGGQVADASAKRQPADTGRPDHAARSDEPERLRRSVDVEPSRPALGAGDPRLGLDLDAAHAGEVDDQAVVEDAVACWVVPAAADGDLEVMRTCEVEGGSDVGCAHALGDQRGSSIDERVEADACSVVLGICGRQHDARE
jgi:hypothetical protein